MSSSDQSNKLKIITNNTKRKPKPENLLSEEQIKYIYDVLRNSLKEDDYDCISREKLWDELSGPLKLKQQNIKQYQFDSAIRALLKNNKFEGFTVRSGRNGGICRIHTKRK